MAPEIGEVHNDELITKEVKAFAKAERAFRKQEKHRKAEQKEEAKRVRDIARIENYNPFWICHFGYFEDSHSRQ